MLSTIGVRPDLAAAIKERHSVRHYQRRRVPPDLVQQVAQVGRRARPLYPELGTRWYVVWEGSVVAERLGGLAGLYDLFTSAPHYIIAVSEERPGYMENLGFCMQQLVLAATAQGLGTCWIGEMCVEDELRDLVPDLATDERIVALTPLGYEDESEPARMVQQLVRWSTERQGDRKPLHEIVSRDIWAIPWTSGLYDEPVGEPGGAPGGEERLEQAFEWVRLAPSWANVQPWHLVVDTVADDLPVVATVCHTPTRGNVHEGKPYYRLDGGIAMYHLDLAAQAFGWPSARRFGPRHRPRWHILGPVGQAQARARYGIPGDHDILGLFV